jgi:hypothetical protein
MWRKEGVQEFNVQEFKVQEFKVQELKLEELRKRSCVSDGLELDS